MRHSLVLTIAILLLGVIAWRRKTPAPALRRSWVPGAALVILLVPSLFFLIFGVGELLEGDISGAFHLPPALLTFGLFFFARRLPLETGYALIVLGVAVWAIYVDSLPVLAAPYLLAGGLLVWGSLPERRLDG